jgi:hypothetical protein
MVLWSVASRSLGRISKAVNFDSSEEAGDRSLKHWSISAARFSFDDETCILSIWSKLPLDRRGDSTVMK